MLNVDVRRSNGGIARYGSESFERLDDLKASFRTRGHTRICVYESSPYDYEYEVASVLIADFSEKHLDLLKGGAGPRFLSGATVMGDE